MTRGVRETMYLANVWEYHKYHDFMFQAVEMARPYFKDGWHLVYAQLFEDTRENGNEKVIKGTEESDPGKG